MEIAEAELPDVILLDVMMPRMDGFEVCRRLKANPRTADLPVVMVTALSDAANRLRGLEAGADDFLTKPVNDIALFARVRSLVRLKRMMEEWRLRDEICGRFGGDADCQPPTDVGPARILIVEEDAFAAARMAETLAIAHRVSVVGSCAEAQSRLDAEIELVIASLTRRRRRPAAPRLAMPGERAVPPAADPADRRGATICPASPKGSISAPTTI